MQSPQASSPPNIDHAILWTKLNEIDGKLEDLRVSVARLDALHSANNEVMGRYWTQTLPENQARLSTVERHVHSAKGFSAAIAFVVTALGTLVSHFF